MTDTTASSTETVSTVAQLLDAAARVHAERGESVLARRFRMRAKAVRELLQG